MCDFCNKVKPKNWTNIVPERKFQNDSLASDFSAIISGNKIVCDYDAYSCDSSFYEEIEISFCPICGSKLQPTNGTNKDK